MHNHTWYKTLYFYKQYTKLYRKQLISALIWCTSPGCETIQKYVLRHVLFSITIIADPMTGLIQECVLRLLMLRLHDEQPKLPSNNRLQDEASSCTHVLVHVQLYIQTSFRWIQTLLRTRPQVYAGGSNSLDICRLYTVHWPIVQADNILASSAFLKYQVLCHLLKKMTVTSAGSTLWVHLIGLSPPQRTALNRSPEKFPRFQHRNGIMRMGCHLAAGCQQQPPLQQQLPPSIVKTITWTHRQRPFLVYLWLPCILAPTNHKKASLINILTMWSKTPELLSHITPYLLYYPHVLDICIVASSQRWNVVRYCCKCTQAGYCSCHCRE